MACRLTVDGWLEPSHSKPCLGPPGAHPARLRAPLARCSHGMEASRCESGIPAALSSEWGTMLHVPQRTARLATYEIY